MARLADPTRDAAACAAAYAPHVAVGAASFEETPPDAEAIAGRMRRVLERFPWLVAERDGEVAGYAYAGPHRDRAAYRWAVDVAVYVHEAHQRQGVGRELYGDLLPLLARQGFTQALAGITVPNAASVALHEAFGFQLVGVYRDIGFKAGAWRDVGWWQLALRPGEQGDRPAEPVPLPQLDPPVS
ncbi:arsinothricin resistance N-acetyltransferase ArsN1 family B [Conexibacter sp. SYSU D00693]|uniref:arsinothricin resistance N-acetyltransferase ArsN1 family B n=1 Tax=Conexibacter sp. SYSU D00693 TaxID=2812560 RepID=UPI00196B6F2F|nr:arsinothricin resistance N-acetyltransferase ArsN1 family B [Conexibacter sp. SYSU D00693]